ncbi:hypothetical protein, conserved [Eimeria brunetti]|uniref:Ubiquitin-like domain-containing protein n=1 Tax=Eimeria brunetti TaxID=51314 RepID=U6LPA7_9EIME|nr:hypothetical protein, conserved [Eimeria brunetti]
MSDFQLREEEPADGRTIDDIVDGVAEDLGLSREVHLEALADALKGKKLCGVVHPYIADALYNRLNNKPNETFEYDVYPEARLQTRNPTHFKNAAIFVHRVAPIPGSNKGKIGENSQQQQQQQVQQQLQQQQDNTCTWAFDVDPEECRVQELQQRLARLAAAKPERMRLVFNGFTLSAANMLSEYDVRAGDSLYLYTLKDANEITVVCCSSCSSSDAPHAAAAPDYGCGCGCGCGYTSNRHMQPMQTACEQQQQQQQQHYVLQLLLQFPDAGLFTSQAQRLPMDSAAG